MMFLALTPSRHPFRSRCHPTVWLLVAVLLLGVAGPAAAGDDPKPQKKKKQPLAEQFLVFGTVFDDRGFLFPGARIRIRREGEKKVRGEATSDRRGEFGIRVPTGEEYELEVEAKGFKKETRKIDARNGQRHDLVFRLEPAPKGGKK